MGVIDRLKRMLALRHTGRLILVLERNQSFMVGDDCLITYLRDNGDRCVLAIQAPADVKVLRASVIEREARNLCDQAVRDFVPANAPTGQPLKGADIFDRIVEAVIGSTSKSD